MDRSFERRPLERRHSLHECSTPLNELFRTQSLVIPTLDLTDDSQEESQNVRFFFETAEGEVMKTLEIVGNPTCADLIGVLLDRLSPFLRTDSTLCDEFSLIQMTQEGEKLLCPEDQPLSKSESNLGYSEKFGFLLKDNRKIDRKSNPTTPDPTLRLNSFFSGDYKLTPSSSSNYSLVSTMSSDSSSTNNTGGSTPMLSKPFLTPNLTRRNNNGPTNTGQLKFSTFGRDKSYSRSKSIQIRKKSSFGGFFKNKSKKKDSDDLELPKHARKYSTFPSPALDDFVQTSLFIPIHICILNGLEKRIHPTKLPLTYDLTVDKALCELLTMEGIPKDDHDLYGLYEIPICGSTSPGTSRVRSRSLAWGDSKVKRLDGGEKLIALHTLSKTSPFVQRRFELRRNSSLLSSSNHEQHVIDRRYRTVNFGDDYYNDVGPSPTESECILDPPSTFSSLTSPTENETTEIEKPKEMEFASESLFSNKEAREEEINNLLDIYPTPSQYPFLLALRSYPLLTSLLIHLNDAVVYIGSEYQEERLGDNSTFVSIKGSDIKTIHCRFSFSPPSHDSSYSAMAIEPIADAKVLLNSKPILFSTKVNPGDLIQLGDHFLFMYRDPLFEHQHPSYRLNWTAQLGSSLPQTDTTHVLPTAKLNEASIEKCRLDSLSEINLRNLHSTSVNSDDGFHSIGSLSPNEKKSMLFNLANLDSLIKAVTKNFDMESEKGKLVPACILSQGFEHSHKTDISCAVDFFKHATVSLTGSIMIAITKLNYLRIEHTFPSQALRIYESISNQFESTLQWLNNGLEFIRYPAAYFASIDVTDVLPDEITQGISKLETIIADGFNSVTEFFDKILRPSLAGLIDENHVLLNLSPTSSCTETSGYISSTTPTHSRGSPSPRRNASNNPNIEIVIELLQLFHKTLHDTYTSSELIPELFTRLFAHIKKFLSNFIFEHGEELALYSQSKGRQMSYAIEQIEQWASRTALKEEYETPQTSLKSVLYLLSTPGEELIKMDWNKLRKRHSSLTPPQLHHILLHYILPGIPGVPGLPGAPLVDYVPHIPLVITPEHWMPSITDANSAFNRALVKERGYLPLPFTFPNIPYILQPKKVPTDIPFERYVDKLLAGLKDKPPSSPESYRSSSNTVSPLPELDLDCGLDDLVVRRSFESFDDIMGISDLESSFSNALRKEKFPDYHHCSSENHLFDHRYDDNPLSYSSQGSLNSLRLRRTNLDRPKSLECIHRYEKSDSSLASDSECGLHDASASQYQVSAIMNRVHRTQPLLKTHPLRETHSPLNDLKSKNMDADLLELLGTPEDSSDSEGELTPDTIRKQICRTTLSFDIKPYSPLLPRSAVSTEDETKSDSDSATKGASSFISSYRDVRLARDPKFGFGLVIVGGEKTRERIPGIYVRSIKSGSPASKCRDLSVGCKVLSINGVSLFPTEITKAKRLILNSDEEILFKVLPCHRNF